MVLPSLLLKSGALQLAVTFVWGTMIPQTPYPRIALSAHMNMIQEGLMAIAAGYLVRDSGLVHLSEWQMGIVVGAHLGIWIFDIAGMCNSFWGTNRTLKMVAKAADAPGGKDWQETIVGLAGTVIPLPLIPAWGLIAWSML